MSIDTCAHCDRWIDADDDPDCYVEIGNMKRLHKTICLCEPCRDRRQQEIDAQEEEAARAQTEAEQQEALLRMDENDAMEAHFRKHPHG